MGFVCFDSQSKRNKKRKEMNIDLFLTSMEGCACENVSLNYNTGFFEGN